MNDTMMASSCSIVLLMEDNIMTRHGYLLRNADMSMPLLGCRHYARYVASQSGCNGCCYKIYDKYVIYET